MLAIIPARAGSKGIPGKNKKIFCGKPLIEWTIESALKANCIDKILVSTDDLDILENKYVNENVDFLIARPDSISSDSSPAVDYIRHALQSIASQKQYEYFCVLQPTSPLRKNTDIEALYNNVLDRKLNSGVTVVKVPHNYAPESLMLHESGIVKPSNASLETDNLRQGKKEYYARNGSAVYICKTDYFLEREKIFDDKMAFWEMDALASIDIDTEDDFKMAELIMQDRLC